MRGPYLFSVTYHTISPCSWPSSVALSWPQCSVWAACPLQVVRHLSVCLAVWHSKQTFATYSMSWRLARHPPSDSRLSSSSRLLVECGNAQLLLFVPLLVLTLVRFFSGIVWIENECWKCVTIAGAVGIAQNKKKSEINSPLARLWREFP